MAVINCPHCGKYISSTLAHCTECGKELPAGLAASPQEPQIDHSLDIIEGYENDDATELFEKQSLPTDDSSAETPTQDADTVSADQDEAPLAQDVETQDREETGDAPVSEVPSVDVKDEPSPSTDTDESAQPSATPVPLMVKPKAKKWYSLSPRRIVVMVFLAPFVSFFIYMVIADIVRARQLEERAYARLETTTDLLVFEDFLLRFPKSDHAEEVRQRYETMKVEHQMFFNEAANGGREALLAFIEAHPSSPYRAVCERRIDTLDWNEALDLNTLDAYTAYLAKHPEGIFQGDATEARNRQLRLVVTPEETSILRGAVDNFLAAMTARDASRIDELTRGTVNFCGMTEATGENVVDYYMHNIHKDDVLGVHFQLGGTSINKRNVAGSDALSYNLYSTATATINRSSLDSAMVVNYKVSASFSPERRLTSVTVTPVVEAPQPTE